MSFEGNVSFCLLLFHLLSSFNKYKWALSTCSVRNKRFKGTLLLLERLTYRSLQCNKEIAGLVGHAYVSDLNQNGQNLLSIKGGVCAELERWKNIDQVKKEEEGIPGEGARYRNEQEMSDRKTLITNKLYDTEGWGPLFFPTKRFRFVKITFSLHVMVVLSVVLNSHSHVVALYIHMFARAWPWTEYASPLLDCPCDLLWPMWYSENRVKKGTKCAWVLFCFCHLHKKNIAWISIYPKKDERHVDATLSLG